MRERNLGNLLFVMCVAGTVQSQTLVDLQRQSKNVDFSGSVTTKPFKSGTVLPGSCAVGEMFFKTNAVPGLNVYTCFGQNNWAVQAGATAADQLTDMAAIRTSSAVITFSFPTGGTDFRCNNFVINFIAPATLTLGALSAANPTTFFLYFDCAASALKVDASAGGTLANVTATNITKGNSGATGYPIGGFLPLYRLNAGVNGVDQWNTGPTAITDDRSVYSMSFVRAGAFETCSISAQGLETCGIDTTLFTKPTGLHPVTADTLLPGASGVAVCDDGAGGIKDTGCIAPPPPPPPFDPADTTVAWDRDEFLNNGAGVADVSSGIGKFDWSTTSGVGVSSSRWIDSPDSNHPGVFGLGASAAGSVGMSLNGAATSAKDPFGPPNTIPASGSWEFRFVVRPVQYNGGVLHRVGIDATVGGVPGDVDGVTVRGLQGTDTNWTLRTCKASVCTTTASTTPIVANVWAYISIKSTLAGTVVATITQNGVTSTASSAVNVTTAVCQPWFAAAGGGTQAVSMDIDLFTYSMTGLVRY